MRRKPGTDVPMTKASGGSPVRQTRKEVSKMAKVGCPRKYQSVKHKHYGSVSRVNIAKLPIPKLATGAVIPPNREFMAVLGDQKSGTNIETPLATMVQAFKQALAESGYGGSNEAVLVLDKDVLGKVVYRLNKAEGTRIGVNLSEVQG